MGMFQENLKRIRSKRGFKSAKQFAAALGIGYTRYINYENKGREPDFETLVKIADALHVTTDELLGHEVDKYGKMCKYLVFLGFTVEPNKNGKSVRISFGKDGGMFDYWVYSSIEALYNAVRQAKLELEEEEKQAAISILRAKFYRDLSLRYDEVLSTVKSKRYSEIEKKLNQPPAAPGIIKGGPVFIFDNHERSADNE